MSRGVEDREEVEHTSHTRNIVDNLIANGIWYGGGLLLGIIGFLLSALFGDRWWQFALLYFVFLSIPGIIWWFDRRALVTRVNTIQAELERQRATLETTLQLAELDDSLLRLLAELPSAADKHVAMRNLLTEFIRDTTRLFAGDVSRASILRPCSNVPYLCIWASIGMPATKSEQTPFYVGPETNIRRGTAGVTFSTGKLRVVHMVEGKADDTEYVDSEEVRHFAPYRAFVSVPISIGSNDARFGVLCLDSMNADLFNSEQIQDALLLIGRRIAAAIAVYVSLVGPLDGAS